MAGRGAVEEKRLVAVALAGIDRRPRRCVHDHVGSFAGHHRAHGCRVGHVEIGAGKSAHIVARLCRGIHQLATQLAAGARDENFHAPLTTSL